MKAIILNYTDISVLVADIPDNCVTTEQVEDYLSLELGLHLDEINYMTTSDDEIPVYKAGDMGDKRIATITTNEKPCNIELLDI